MIEGTIVTIIFCGSLIGLGSYLQSKKQRNQIQRENMINFFLQKINQFENDLKQETRDFKILINQVYNEFYKISTQFQSQSIFQENHKRNTQSIQSQVDHLISELINLKPSTFNIIDQIEKKASSSIQNPIQDSFYNLLTQEIREDVFKKQIKLEEVYLIQIFLILINSFPIQESIEYVCFRAHYLFNSIVIKYLRKILIYKISQQNEETILSIFEKLYKTDDSRADEKTLIQIYSLPNISLESKKIFIKGHIYKFKNDDSSSTLLNSAVNNWILNEQNSGDFMVRIKRLINMHSKKE
ncbi:transmembrane protein, putative (macronuclear) [Tetrahymena thermophila SB210]|uniref:Transmembrane protein, putative n=1 Tax=Tetrahymena thermophila (strain SB210) TaxID=312017 RepID=I7LXR7_TETTS|nr:transmembrane protein, putative [Tetrahymena thermophila SB210]EAS05997.2 transmembrane protein, putative [Tetrahymena thermophila SB210]|eukprot:XP_001026242.2 transmembrane protein, putative [Tetrahymena thermophila SB210]